MILVINPEQLNYLIPTLGSWQLAEPVMSHVGSLQFVHFEHHVTRKRSCIGPGIRTCLYYHVVLVKRWFEQ